MAAKIVIVACAIWGVVRGEPPSTSYGTPLAPPVNSYGSSNYDVNADNLHAHHDQGDHGEPKSYEFGYQVKDDYTGNNYNRKEASDGNQVRGEYRVQLPDGRTQIVTYYADWQTGFHADVRYEGTAQYPEQYNTYQGGYNNGPSGQYGAPNYPNNGGNSATSSVSIKDYSAGAGGAGGTAGYNNNGYNGNYDSYAGNYANKGRPNYEYGAP